MRMPKLAEQQQTCSMLYRTIILEVAKLEMIGAIISNQSEISANIGP